MALVAYKGWAVDDTGAVIAYAGIEIRERDGSTATTIYSDANGTAQANPYTAAADGSFLFWAPEGRYDARVGPSAAPAVKPITLVDPGLGDFADRSDAAAFVASLSFAALDDGAVFFADGLSYRKSVGATGIADMPDVLPAGEFVCPRHFGAVGDGVANDTIAVRACYSYANPLRFNVSFCGMEGCLIDHDAEIQVRVPTDGMGCHLKAANGVVLTPDSGTVNTMFVIEDGGTPLVTGQVATPAADGSKVADLTAGSTRACGDFMQDAGYAYLEGSGGSGPNIVERYEADVVPYRQSFAIGVNGRSLQPISLDMSAETQLYFETRAMPSSGNLKFHNFNVDMSTFNNQEIVRVSRNNTSVSNIQFMQEDGTSDPDTINRLIKVYKAAYVYIDDITAHAQQDGGDGGGTYVYNYENFAEVYMNRCHGTDGWGAMGTNHGNGLYITNCNLNRVDFHNGGHNYFVSDCTIYNRGIFLGWGGGSLKVTDCKFIDAPVIQYRADYGGIFWGDIVIDGAEGIDQGFTWTVVDADTNPVGSAVLSGPVARSIIVRNVHRTDGDDLGGNREIVPVHITVDPDVGTLAPVAPSNIHVENVSGAGNWRVQCYVDYQNMSLPDDVDNCTWNFANVKATRTNFDGGGIHIPAQYAGAASGVGDYRVQLRVSNSTKISVNVDEHPKVDVYAYDNDLNRLVAPAGAEVEIDGGVMQYPDLQGAETHTVVGNTKSGTGYTTVRNVKVQGIDASSGWDFSNVETLIGVDIPDVTTNEGIILPAGCLPAHAFFGWRKDDPTGEITPDFWGRNANPGVTDMTSALEEAIEYAAGTGQTLHLKGNYAFTNLNPSVSGSLVSIQGAVGSKLTQLSTRDPDVTILDLSAAKVAEDRSVVTVAYAGDRSVVLDDASNFADGCIVQLQTNHLIEGDHRFLDDYCVQQTLKVESVDLGSNTVTFTTPLLWDISLGVIATGTAQGGASGQITLRSGETATRDDVRNRQIRIVSGTGAGQTRYIHEYDEGTETVSLGIDYYGGGSDFDQDDWDVVPDATSVYEIFADCDAHCWDAYHPEIRGLHLIGYEEDGVNVRGMNIGFADKPLVEFCHIEGCSNHGLYTLNSFQPTIRYSRFERANYAYEVDGNYGAGLGYGYLSSGDFGGQFYGNIMSGCRTGADVIKGTYDMKRFNNHVYGGGKTFDGEDFYPVGLITNSGLSSHTGAINVYDSGNYCHDIYQNKIRGHHICNGNNRSGSAVQGYYISNTKKAHVLNDNYSDVYTYTPLVSDSVFETGSDGPVYPETPPELPKNWVNINQASMVENASVIVRGNTVSSLGSDFVRVSDQSTESDLMLEVVGNHVTTVKDSGSGDVSVVNSLDPLSLGKLVCHSNDLHWGGDAAGSIAYDNFSPYPIVDQLEPSDMVVELGNGTFAAVMASNGRIIIPTGLTRNSFWISAYHNSDVSVATGWHWSGVVGRVSGAVYEATSNNATFHPADTKITAGSVASGQIHLSIMANGTIMFLNRTGAEGTFIIELGQRL